jgi:hypothetical protein
VNSRRVELALADRVVQLDAEAVVYPGASITYRDGKEIVARAWAAHGEEPSWVDDELLIEQLRRAWQRAGGVTVEPPVPSSGAPPWRRS